MVIGDYNCGGTDTANAIFSGSNTLVDDVIVFSTYYDCYVEPIIAKKKDPFWTKQGKNKKGGRGRYVHNH